jgi:hypothetical protein
MYFMKPNVPHPVLGVCALIGIALLLVAAVAIVKNQYPVDPRVEQQATLDRVLGDLHESNVRALAAVANIKPLDHKNAAQIESVHRLLEESLIVSDSITLTLVKP